MAKHEEAQVVPLRVRARLERLLRRLGLRPTPAALAAVVEELLLAQLEMQERSRSPEPARTPRGSQLRRRPSSPDSWQEQVSGDDKIALTEVRRSDGDVPGAPGAARQYRLRGS